MMVMMIFHLDDWDGDIDSVCSPSMIRCRSFLLVLSSASTRSSDRENKIRTKISRKWIQKLLANMWPLIFATLLQIVSSNEKNAIKAKMRRKSKPNIASTKHLLLEYWQQEQILLLALRWKSAHISNPELILPFCFKFLLGHCQLSIAYKGRLIQIVWLLGLPAFLPIGFFLNEGFLGGWHRWCGQRSISGKFGTKFGFYTNLWQ